MYLIHVLYASSVSFFSSPACWLCVFALLLHSLCSLVHVVFDWYLLFIYIFLTSLFWTELDSSPSSCFWFACVCCIISKSLKFLFVRLPFVPRVYIWLLKKKNIIAIYGLGFGNKGRELFWYFIRSEGISLLLKQQQRTFSVSKWTMTFVLSLNIKTFENIWWFCGSQWENLVNL